MMTWEANSPRQPTGRSDPMGTLYPTKGFPARGRAAHEDLALAVDIICHVLC